MAKMLRSNIPIFVFLRVFSWQNPLARSGNSFPFFPPDTSGFPAKIPQKVLLYLIAGLHYNVGFIIFSHRDIHYNFNSFHLIVFYI